VTLLDAVREHLITLDLRDKNWSAALATAQQRGPEVDLPLTDLSTPIFTVDLNAVADNLAAMRDWTAERGVSLAPHGKTTMCPALWQWQLDEGSWAITVANEPQLRVARAAGIPRVVVANEYLSPSGLAWLAGELDADPEWEVTVWVDSTAAVELMTRHLQAAGAGRPLPVCVEVGHPNARTGVRDLDEAQLIARAVIASPQLLLRGVSGYEGSVPADDADDKADRVREFLAAMGKLFTAIAPLVETDEALLTAGGSAFFDLVVEILGPVAAGTPNGRLLIRSGAYAVHDDGLYTATTPSATRSGPAFRAAAHVWARVISVPEPTLALLDVGKRDIPYDAGLPVVQEVLRDGKPVEVEPAALYATNDQHGYVRLPTDDALQVGDVVRLGLSHPCTMFDKWRSVLLVEDDRVRGVVPTFF
jgi:D-serine deaminase-like pyridoxal phosphate-dependent protein